METYTHQLEFLMTPLIRLKTKSWFQSLAPPAKPKRAKKANYDSQTGPTYQGKWVDFDNPWWVHGPTKDPKNLSKAA